MKIETAVLVKTQERKNVSREGNQGHCYQWKPKGQCTKGNAGSFRHDENKRGQVTQSSSPAPKPQTQSDEAVVLLERDIKDRAKTTSVARHVTFGVLPNVNITKHNRDANLVKSASSGTKG